MDIEKPKKKKRRVGLIILLVIVGLLAAVGATGVFAWLSGRKAMTQAPEVIVLPAETIAEAGNDDANTSTYGNDEVLDEYTIRRNGKLYRQKQNVMTFLFLGVDKNTLDSVDNDTGLYPSNARADVLLLAVMDADNNTTKFLTLSRDTMCGLDVYDLEGNYKGVGYGQIALSYRYGDGELGSCQLTQKAVSELLYNLPINSTSAFYLDGIGVMNDAVGGITLSPVETIEEFEKGKEVTLDGDEAIRYIWLRDYTIDGNLNRMERQKQYFKALLNKLIDKVKADPTCVLGLYRTVDEYMVTDLTVNEILYLASEAVQMDISGDVVSIPGEISVNDQNYAEYHINEKETSDIIIDLYYEEVTD